VADSAAHVRQEVEASFMHYFRTVVAQLRLGERDQSASYAYLSEVRQRMEAITWEQTDATMALYGSPALCVQKIREVHERCGMEQVICWFNPGGLVPHQQVLLVCDASPRRSCRRCVASSAGLTNLLCNRCEVLTSVVVADTLDQFLCRQEACRFQNRPLAMDPPRFNRVEPGTLAG
jgi:hypothetical protein